MTNPRLSADTTLLCYQAFAVLYSGLSRTPLYAAEHLTAARVEAARRIDRVDAFHEEDRLPGGALGPRGLRRQRLGPGPHGAVGRHAEPGRASESFSLANIVPQDPDLNRRLWAGIESSVRALAIERGDLFVVTGPLFEGASVQSLRGRVLIPTRLFKAVYDANRGEAGVYLARNAAPGETWEAISLDQLAAIGGIVAFPDLPDSVRRRIMTLPEPRRDEYAGGPRSRREPGFLDWLAAELRRAARRAWRDFLRSLF